MKKFIVSTKYSLKTRQTKKHGVVYDVVFRIYDEDGTERQKTIGGLPSKTAAKYAHAEFVADHCEILKRAPVRQKAGRSFDRTVGDLSKDYIAALQNQCRDSTIYDREKIFVKFILPKYNDTPISKLDKAELYRWQDEIWQSKNAKTGAFFSYAYLCKIRGTFAAFYSWAAERYDIANYFASIKKPKRNEPKKEMQIWTREEFDQFISAADKPMYRCLFSMLFFTGRRKGEVLALKNDAVKKETINFSTSLTQKTIDGSAVKITATKASKTQTSPICPALQRELARYEGGKPFFFGGKRPISANAVSNAFKKYTEKSGVKKIRIHDLRHSFVSMLVHNGANLTVVADLINDTLEQVTKTYAHLYDEDKTSVLARIK